MGLGKSIKKAIKKVTKYADPLNLTGKNTEEAPKEAPAATVSAPPAPVVAATVEAPKTEDTTTDDDGEAAKKAARAAGKRGLQVARKSGTGINI